MASAEYRVSLRAPGTDLEAHQYQYYARQELFDFAVTEYLLILILSTL